MCLSQDVRTKTTLRLSLIALLLFFLLQIPARHSPRFHPDVIDGLRGFFLGISIAAIAVAARRNGRRAI